MQPTDSVTIYCIKTVLKIVNTSKERHTKITFEIPPLHCPLRSETYIKLKCSKETCITRSPERRIKMDKKMKIIALIALLAYVISPVDAIPGPVDDMIMCLLYAVMNYKSASRELPEEKPAD